jgi:hypothetical protein
MQYYYQTISTNAKDELRKRATSEATTQELPPTLTE